MATITVTGTMTVDIHLDNLSMESYNRLTAFLEGLERGDKPAEYPSSPKPKQGQQSQEQLRDEERTRAVYILLTDANAHPDRFEWKWMTSKDLMPYLPELLRKCDGRFIGHTMTLFSQYGMIEKRVGDKMRMEYNYPFAKAEHKPEPVKGEESKEPPKTLNYRDQMMGERLRKARKGASLSITELSQAIGYGADIINRWETGCYHMAEAQRDCINKYFGRDVFATA